MVDSVFHHRDLRVEVGIKHFVRSSIDTIYSASGQLTYSVALVVLASDSLEAVWPVFTSDQWKFVSLIVYVYHPTNPRTKPARRVVLPQRRKTDGQNHSIKLRPPSVAIFLIRRRGDHHLGPHWNPGILRSGDVSLHPCLSYNLGPNGRLCTRTLTSSVNISLDRFANLLRLISGLIMGWSSWARHSDSSSLV